MPRTNWMMSIDTTPTLAIRTLAALAAGFTAGAIFTSDIAASATDTIQSHYGSDVRSVLRSLPSSSQPGSGEHSRSGSNKLLLAGIAVFVIGFGGWLAYLCLHMEDWTLNMIDLSVYRSGGLIVRQVTEQVSRSGTVSHYYNAHAKPSPLYGWTRSGGKDSLQFTYPPFAAVAFALVSFLSTGTSTVVDTIVNFLALLAAMWFTIGGLARQY